MDFDSGCEDIDEVIDDFRASKRIDKKRKKNNARSFGGGGSGGAIIVLDLDNTLIDDKYVPFPKSIDFLKKIFCNSKNTVFMWTAGNTIHADKYLELLETQYNLNRAQFHNIICGLIDNSKPNAKIKEILRDQNTHRPHALIDDKEEYFKNNTYDITIPVKKYYRFHGKKEYYINYDNLYDDLIDRIEHFYSKKRKFSNKMKNFIDLDSD